LAGKFTDVLSDGQGVQPLGQTHVDSVSTHAPAGAIIVPDAHLLFTGDFKRAGVDLVIKGGERELVLQDYFKGEKRAVLASPDGAHLTGDLVNALTGHTRYAQLQADGSPSVAQVIGNVTKLSGTATAIRNGVSIVLNQGDAVNKGDVVQSGSDSTLGITFIDGTVFGLGSNARMVLNEMIYDPAGSNNKSLLSLVQGTISFVAGATAKNGDMKVDTPVATMGIRGTAVLVEIDFEVPGQGGAPPAKFQVLVEPDGTTGSYILFDKTTLTPIATVNQAGTQTIINGQGTVSFLSSVQLSPDAQKIITDVFSLKFSDLNNPNTKLTTNFTDSIVPQTTFLKLANGAEVPVTLYFASIPDKPAATQVPVTGNKLEHIPGPPDAHAFSGSLTERANVTASASVDSVTGNVNYADINAGDVPSVTTAFSSFKYQNAQRADVTASLTSEQLAAIHAVEKPLVVVQDPNGRNYGTATWTYNIADGAFDFLAADETLTLTYLAQVDNNYAPNNETKFVPFTITITGTNDKPTITTTGGAILERDGTGNTAVDTVTGTVTFTDTDLTDRPIVSTAFSSFIYRDADGNDVTVSLTPEQVAAIVAVEKPLTVVQGAGNGHNGTATWTYSIADHAFDFIAKGETLTLIYVATVNDGHGGVTTTSISVQIDGADVEVIGTNDVPTIGTTSAEFAERSNADQPNPTGSTDLDTVSGTISFTDVDLTDRPVASAAFTSFTYQNAAHVVQEFLSDTQLAAIAAVHPSLSVVQAGGNANNGSASWTYSVADSAFDFLADGEILTLTYTATVDDGHGGVVTKPLTVTVTGTNDTAVITSPLQTGSIKEIEGALASDALDTDTGTITFTDADLTDTHDVAIVGDVDASGVVTGLANGTVQLSWLTLGSLTDSTDGVPGSRSWTFSAPDSYFDYLADGETVTLTYTVEIDDHHGGVTSQQVAVTVEGSDDAPVVAEIAQKDLIETTDTSALTATIPVTFTDVDLTDVDHTAAVTGVEASGDITGLGLDEAALIALVRPGTVTKNSGSSSGSVDLSFSAASTVFDYLADGEQLTLTYTVAIDDGDGGVRPQTFVVTVEGTNDTPVVAMTELTGEVTELVTPVGNLTDSGVIAFTDVDLSDTHSISPTVTASAGALGGLTATVSTDTVGGLGGEITWNYSVAASAVEYLAAGEPKTESFTITLDDGHGGTVERTIEVTITGTNDTPTVASVDTAPIADTAIADTFGNLTGTLAGNDVDSGETVTLTYAAVGLGGATNDPVAGLYGSLTVDEDGNYTYVPNAAAINALPAGAVVDTFMVQTKDIHGAIGATTFTVNVTGANDAPVAQDDVAAITGNTGNVTGHLLANDSDAELASLSVSNVVDGVPSSGHFTVDGIYGELVVDTATGDYTYTLGATSTQAAAVAALGDNVAAYDDFTYTASDGTLGAEGNLKVTVTGVNDAPLIHTEAITISEDENGVKTLHGLIVTDADANEVETFNVSTEVDSQNAVVTPSSLSNTLAMINSILSGGVTYDPDENAPDADMVTLTVTDGNGQSDTVNFIFSSAVEGPISLVGTEEKDVIFATGNDDTLTGLAGADQFVFLPQENPSADTITDFTTGQDHIDLRAFSEVNSANIDTWLGTHAAASGDDTLITLDGGDTIRVKDVATLHVNDFIVHYA
jgi:VCBS repeat-containing protein